MHGHTLHWHNNNMSHQWMTKEDKICKFNLSKYTSERQRTTQESDDHEYDENNSHTRIRMNFMSWPTVTHVSVMGSIVRVFEWDF